MQTFAAILRLIGSLVSFLGLVSVFIAAFDLGLRYKRTDLPDDVVGALMLLGVGLVFFGIGWAIERRKRVAS